MRQVYNENKLVYRVVMFGAIIAFALAAVEITVHLFFPSAKLSQGNLERDVQLYLIGILIILAMVFDLVWAKEADAPYRHKFKVLLRWYFWLTLLFIFLGMVILQAIADPRQLWYDLNNLFG